MFYHIIRRLHLYATFLLATFILMYFITGFVMIFEDTFKRKEIELEQIKKPISSGIITSEHSLIQWLSEELEIRGQYRSEENVNSITVHFSHPGTLTSAKVLKGVDTVFITIQKGNTYAVMHNFHRLHGYHGGMNYFVWSVFYDLSAASMILFAVTGLYLWWKTTRKRLVGLLVLLSFTALTAFTIIYLMVYS